MTNSYFTRIYKNIQTRWFWWIAFVSLNFLLFTPRIFVSKVSMLEEWQSRESFFRYLSFLFRRRSDDIFHLSIELILILWLSSIFSWNNKVSKWTFGLTYLLFLVYMTYDATFKKLYHFKPIIANDITLIKYGIEIIWSDTPWILLIGIFVFGLLVWVVLLVSRQVVEGFVNYQIQKTWSFRIISMLCVLSIYQLHLDPLLFKGKQHLPIEEGASFNVVTLSILRNISQSMSLQKKISQFDIDELENNNQKLDSLTLFEKPNIYLVFVESYGKVLYDHESLARPYVKSLKKYDQRLNEANVVCVSRFSASPVSGGGSWLAYTSMLYGADLATQGLYQKLVNDQSFQAVPNFLKWLQRQGYKSIFLSPQATSKRVPDYDTYGKFYGVDTWIKPSAFESYSGPKYGWGSIPPDQFLLHFTKENFFSTGGSNVLFFLTKNSHSPFMSPSQAVLDWREIKESNEPDKTANFSDKPDPSDYLAAINYELDYLTLFAGEMESDDVLILIGDHQPPMLTKPSNDNETMIHLLSKNVDFIQSFSKYGFTEGLECKESTDEFAHKDILWPLVTEISMTYGK